MLKYKKWLILSVGYIPFFHSVFVTSFVLSFSFVYRLTVS